MGELTGIFLTLFFWLSGIVLIMLSLSLPYYFAEYQMLVLGGGVVMLIIGLFSTIGILK